MGTIFTCPHCDAVYFINWNGQPEMASHDEEAGASSAASSEFVSDYNEAVPAIEQGYTPEEITEQPADQNYSPNQFESEEGEQNFGDQGFVSSESTEEAAFDFSQTLDYVEPAPAPSSNVSDDANFADVIEFANANVGAGPLAYTVFIEGIESSQLVYQLREAMTDSRFGWDVNELLTHIGGGRLTLTGLTPAKASVLINRIKYLPFKITWRQDVLSGS
ncbi:MAG: hypothetical protein ACM3MG_01800 [Bacillota bacterium]